MIDSIVIQLRDSQFEIEDYKAFTGRSIRHLNHAVTVREEYSTIAKEYKKLGLYFPQIRLPERTVRKQGQTIRQGGIEIQVSLPKLLFGTNMFEMKPENRDEVYIKLVECLKKLHINTTVENIKSAVLKRVDFAKVVRIPQYFGTAKYVIKKLSSFDYKPSSQFDVREYNDNGGGISVKHWNPTQSYTIYDKVGEVRAQGYTKAEKDISQLYDQGIIVDSFVKFEFSLQRKQNLDAVLGRYIKTRKKNFTLEEILSSTHVARSILLEVFDKIFPELYMALVTYSEMEENQLEQELLLKKLGTGKHEKLYYWVNKVRKIGLRATMEEMKERVTPTTFLRQKEDILGLLKELKPLEGNLPHLLAYLRKQHEDFELIIPKQK